MVTDRGTTQALKALEQILNLLEKHEYVEARDQLLELRREHPRGKHSSFISYQLAVSCDYLEDFEMAMGFIEEAVSADPLCVFYRRSFEIIVDRIRQALSAKDRPVDEPSTPKLYQLLLSAGQADSSSHVTMARYHLAKGEAQAARRILESVVTLDPTCRDAWALLVEAAKALGDAERAEQALFEAKALEVSAQPPFAIKGRAQG